MTWHTDRLKKQRRHAQTQPASAPEPAVNLSSMNKTELKDLAQSRGLSTSGTKAELIERLT